MSSEPCSAGYFLLANAGALFSYCDGGGSGLGSSTGYGIFFRRSSAFYNARGVVAQMEMIGALIWEYLSAFLFPS